MAEYRFAPPDVYSSEDFYRDLGEADHLHQNVHRERLLASAAILEDLCTFHSISSWIDYGCGNGGLLSLVNIQFKKGYDILPANVEAAKKLGRPVEFKNFLKAVPEYSDLATATEVLEHLEDPHGFLKNLQCRFLVAGVPNNDTPEHHYEHHVWGWDCHGFAKMIQDAGFEKLSYSEHQFTQFIVAENNEKI